MPIVETLIGNSEWLSHYAKCLPNATKMCKLINPLISHFDFQHLNVYHYHNYLFICQLCPDSFKIQVKISFHS